jgi:hypothetical protein
VSDPVASGIVARLDHPSGNITGFANFEATLGGKWLELLSEIAPGLKRVAIMFNPDTAPASLVAIMFNPDTAPASLYMPSLETAARSLKVVPITVPVHSDVEIETTITALGREPGSGLVVIPDVFALAHRASSISAAARSQVPAVYPVSSFARDGGLFSYGVDMVDKLSSRRHLCRSHSARREARRSPGSASGEIRDGREPQDRQSTRPHGAAIDIATRRRGDRIDFAAQNNWTADVSSGSKTDYLLTIVMSASTSSGHAAA